MNVVMGSNGGFIEVQGTAEAAPFARAQLNAMLDLAEKGIGELFEEQSKALTAEV
jgi:ribonuclease PH